MGKITTTFQFEDELYHRFRDKCKNDDVSMVSRIEIWMRNYLQQPKDDQEIKAIEENLMNMTIEDIKSTIDIIKRMYEAAQNQDRKNRLAVIAKRLKDRYTTLNERKAISNSEVI